MPEKKQETMAERIKRVREELKNGTFQFPPEQGRVRGRRNTSVYMPRRKR